MLQQEYLQSINFTFNEKSLKINRVESILLCRNNQSAVKDSKNVNFKSVFMLRLFSNIFPSYGNQYKLLSNH